MSSSHTMSLNDFLSYFPIVDLPIALSEEVIDKISKLNKIIPPIAIAEYFSKWEEQIDDYTEFLACCQLTPQDDFTSLVYWKGSLMAYEFILVTLDRKGQLIDKKVIAGIISNGSTIKQSVAKIEDDLTIHIMTGEKKVDELAYDPANSKGHYMEILPNGQLISSKEQDLTWQEKNSNKEN